MSGRSLVLAAALAMPLPAAAQAPLAPSSNCKADLEQLAGWSGVWMAEGLQADINGREPENTPGILGFMKLSVASAPLNDEGYERLGSHARDFIAGQGKIGGWSYPLFMSAPAPFKFVISPSETAIISQYRDIRYVYTDGRPHEPDDERWPTPWGDSIGCWKDGALTIETVGLRYAPDYTALAPPLSENARIVETLRLTAPDRLEGEFTITDPETLERTWRTTMTYERHPVLARLVHDGDTFENDRSDLNGGGSIISVSQDGAKQAKGVDRISLSVAELDKFTGTYAFDAAPLDLIVERRGDRLYFRVHPVLPDFQPLVVDDPVTFTSPVLGGTFRFAADGSDANGTFTGTSPDGVPISGKRKPS